ncbi:hypothetical protein [Endozoicomonas sp. SCSIO W0465]|uniref:hypothetical protein n=1 Tax=Endozoicomonas sp. SCSIO W0465 TaxID=2918516 RepID=UPI0020760CA2|nr:hypothetical protein [Endozoicomonas sp. SCSIO W0465]USE35639.1 hypothetical protein MJO57_26770 [Endozoicomonas sp. SCSIO W0465]
MSDPLGVRISALNLNDAQPIPATLSDSSSAAFASHCVSITAAEKAGSLDCRDSLSHDAGNKTLDNLQIASVSESGCSQPVNLPHSRSVGIQTLFNTTDVDPSVALSDDQGEPPQPIPDADSMAGACAAASDAESEATEPNHDECSTSHTDACRNDHRWIALNQKERASKEQRLRSANYEYWPLISKKFPGGTYQVESGVYNFEPSAWNYSHVKITRCDDGKDVVNLVRDFVQPLHHHFLRLGQEWVLTGHSYTSPLLVNLSTGKAYEDRGDHYYAGNFLWHKAEASTDGNTLVVKGLIWGGFPEEIRFYDFSNPDQGFKHLHSEYYLWPGREEYDGWPTWQATEDSGSVATFYMQDKPKAAAPVYSVTVRREGDRMIEERREIIQ